MAPLSFCEAEQRRFKYGFCLREASGAFTNTLYWYEGKGTKELELRQHVNSSCHVQASGQILPEAARSEML